MTAKHGAGDQHASAKIHHEQAARYHSEATRHGQVGPDYAHAAHLEVAAHGHALQALGCGNEALKYYTNPDAEPLPDAPRSISHFPAGLLEIAGAMRANLSGIEHHAAAATHHEQAAQHHGEASRYCRDRSYALALDQAEIAHEHAQYAVFHGNEAAKHRVRRDVEADPETSAWVRSEDHKAVERAESEGMAVHPDKGDA